MKVHVERREDRASTVVVFEIPDEELRDADRKCGERGMLRPPRLNASNFRNMVARDWIEYIAYLTQIKLTF